MSINLLGDISVGPLDNDHSIGDWECTQPSPSEIKPASPTLTASFLAQFESPPRASSARAAPPEPSTTAGPSGGLLIDVGATPTAARTQLPPSYMNSLPRRPSPLKRQALLSDSTTSTLVDLDEHERERKYAPAPPVFREIPPSPELARNPPFGKHPKKRASPIKSLLREIGSAKGEMGDVSTLSFGFGGGEDQSLIADEAGSFVAGAADFTLDNSSASLSPVGQEEESTSAGSDKILPASLTSSTSTVRAQTPVKGKADSHRAVLACSTASYREERDSPTKPRVVSIQAEQADTLQTPKRKLLAPVADEVDSPELVASPACTTASINLFELSPPTALLHVADTTAVESPVMPILPNVSLIAAETEPDSPSIARIIQHDTHESGQDSVDLITAHADLSMMDLLKTAAPADVDLSSWGDESTMQFPALESLRLVRPTLAPVAEQVDPPAPPEAKLKHSRSPSAVVVGKLVDLATPPRAAASSVAGAPLRNSGSTATPGKTPLAISGSERLRLKMAELAKRRAEGKSSSSASESAKDESLCLLDDRPLERVSALAQARPAQVSPEKRRMSVAPTASASRPRTLPTSVSARRLSAVNPTPATPGRSETTRERLERAREDRLRREAERSPEKQLARTSASRLSVDLTRKPSLTRSNSSTSALAGRAAVAPARALVLSGPKPKPALGPPPRTAIQPVQQPAKSRASMASAPSAGASGLTRASSLKSRQSISTAAPTSASPVKSKIASPAKPRARASIAGTALPGLLKLPTSTSAVLGQRANGR